MLMTTKKKEFEAVKVSSGIRLSLKSAECNCSVFLMAPQDTCSGQIMGHMESVGGVRIQKHPLTPHIPTGTLV